MGNSIRLKPREQGGIYPNKGFYGHIPEIKLEVIGYLDFNFAWCQDSKKSMLSDISLLGWRSNFMEEYLQPLVTSSTMEAKLVACCEALNWVIWLDNFIFRLQVVDEIERLLKLFYINRATFIYSNNNKSLSKSKHIDIKFLAIKERVQNSSLSIEHIDTNSMLVGPLTKQN